MSRLMYACTHVHVHRCLYGCEVAKKHVGQVEYTEAVININKYGYWLWRSSVLEISLSVGHAELRVRLKFKLFQPCITTVGAK